MASFRININPQQLIEVKLKFPTSKILEAFKRKFEHAIVERYTCVTILRCQCPERVLEIAKQYYEAKQIPV